MTLFGRHDKNLNDTTSIYQGYDRYQQTIFGGGVNSVSLLSAGTMDISAIPNIYISNATNINCGTVTPILSSSINTITVNTQGSGWTSAQTSVIINGTGTEATALATVKLGAITSIAINNGSSGYNVGTFVSFNGGAFIEITAQMNGLNTIITGYTITSGEQNLHQHQQKLFLVGATHYHTKQQYAI